MAEHYDSSCSHGLRLYKKDGGCAALGLENQLVGHFFVHFAYILGL